MNTELQNLAEKLGIATKFLDAGKNRKEYRAVPPRGNRGAGAGHILSAAIYRPYLP